MSTYKWLRLWHDMPNDPKWRTISRASKQPIALVQAVYIHLLVDASQNVTKCHDGSQQDKDKIRDIKPLSNTREGNFQSNPNANNSILNGSVSAGGFGVNDKFVMYHGWEPDQDFTQKAAYWGTILKEPLQPHELAEFITYWGAEGKAKTHEQWELALAKGLKHSRLKNEKVVKNGAGQRAKIDSQFAGKPKAMQEFLQHVLDKYGQDAVDALAEDDRNLRRQMEKQEWHGAVIDVEASAKRIE